MSLISGIPVLFHLPQLPILPGTSRVVVLLHGTGSEPGVFRQLSLALHEKNILTMGIAYGRRATKHLDSCLTELIDATHPVIKAGRRVDVVGHSLGGLMALRLAHALPEGSITTIVGLGAAWRGTPVKGHRLLRAKVLGESFVQVETGVPFDAIVPPGVEVVSVVSDTDRIVPGWSSRLGQVIDVHGVRHNALPRQVPEILKALGLKNEKQR